MANETTSTSQAALIATEKIADGAIQANLPKMVFNSQLHHDELDGYGTGTKRYPVESDLGAASAATEGTDITTNTEIGMGTSVSLTPTEGVGVKSVITEKVVRRRLGGMPASSVVDLFQSEDEALLTQVLAPDIRRMINMGMQKIEADGLALLAGISNTVGSTGTDITIINLLTAIYTLKTQQVQRPPSEWKFVLAQNQVHEINLEALGTSGGIAGTLWTQQADYSLANRIEDAPWMAGLVGSFLRYPVYEYDSELNVLANSDADVVGALIGGGDMRSAPDDAALGGKVGFGVYLEEQPLSFRFEKDASLRAMEVVMTADYIHGELVDSNAVGIVTDAPA